MKKANKLIALFLTLLMVCSMLPVTASAAEDTSNQFVIMSTTDVHGKVWDKDLLAQSSVSNSLLNVASAVAEIRSEYGDRTLLADAGDLYQGTPVSSYNISKLTQGLTKDPNPMAIALKYMDYDASILGNHEFNYAWDTMEGIYDYLEDTETGVSSLNNGVPVICANLYYESTGERVFAPYFTKTLKVDGADFTIMVIGLENTDCTRWDVPENYPGMLFSAPDNPERDLAVEVQKVLDETKDVKRDFTMVVYHGALGEATDAETLTLGENTENQVLRIIHKTTGIDMVVSGHDHSNAYSGTKYPNAEGKDVLVVNGGGTDLTKTVFKAKHNADGSFTVTQVTGDKEHNVDVSAYPVDESLKALIQPYAEDAENYVSEIVGTLSGSWDSVSTANTLYVTESDTMDLIGRAQIYMGTKYLNEKYASVAEINEKLRSIYGDDTAKQLTGDKVEVDLSSSSVVVNGSAHATAGDVSLKDIYTYYRYDNSLYLIALTGQEIKDLLEFNATNRLEVTFKNGEARFAPAGGYDANFTNPVFYGLNFTYDLAKPEGSRAVIGDFANGKKFDLNETYIFAINNYHLGNSGNTELAKHSTADAIWSQTDDLGGGFVQDLMSSYIKDMTEKDEGVYSNSAAKDGVNGNGETVSHWSITYSGEIPTEEALPDDTAVIGAEVAEITEGTPVIIYNDSESTVLSATPNGTKMSSLAAVGKGNRVYAPEGTAIVTPVKAEGGWYLKTSDGYLTYGATGNSLTVEAAPSALSLWDFESTDGGFFIHCVNAEYNGKAQALEVYNGNYTTYSFNGGDAYLFGVYSVTTTGVLDAEPKDGDKVAIVNPATSTVLGKPSSSKIAVESAYVNPTESGSVAELPADVTLFEVSHNADGKLLLKTEGGYLSYGSSGSSLTLEAEAGDLSLWELEPIEGKTGLYNIHCVNAAYNGKTNQYLEKYYENFTTYGYNGGGDNYEYSFYTVSVTGVTPAEEPKAPEAEKPIEGYILPVIETSDVHGFLVDVSSGVEDTYQYRMAYIADKVNDLRGGEDDTVLLLDGGDIYQGNVVSNLQVGMPMMALYDLMGYDAVALGNHEFDWGVTTVADSDGTMGSYTVGTFTGDSDVPILNSNLTQNGSTVDFVQPYIIVEKTATDKDGNTITVKIGIIGYADDYKADIMAAKFTDEGFVMTEDAKALEALAVMLETKEGCDATVLLGHMDAPKMAAALQKDTVIDLVCGGHSHSGQTGATNGVTYLQPKNQAQNYASVDLVFTTDDEGNITGVATANNEIIDVSSDNKAKLTDTEANKDELDPEIMELSRAAVAVVAPQLKEVLGTVDTSITKSGIGKSDMSSTAGNWMTELMARAVGAQVALTNNGGIRTELTLAEGAATRNITVGDVYTIAPFGNLIYGYELTYPELLTVLDFALNGGRNMGLRMTGIDCYYNGSKIMSLVEDGKVIYQNGQWAQGYETKTIKVATNEYIATSDTPFKAWNGTAKLYDNLKADNESMIEALKAESEANNGVLKVDADAHLVSGGYLGFVDTTSLWYMDSLTVMVENGYMNGTSATTFSPNSPITVGMAATILARVDGVDTAGAVWYETGMTWAAGQDIVTAGTAPETALTREELVLMLWTLEGKPAASESPTDYTDANEISAGCVAAMAWAVENDIVIGANGRIDPGRGASRAEIATIIARWLGE